MPPHRGFGAVFGIGFESTWGTAVARTNWLRAESMGLARERSKVPVKHQGDYGQVSSMMREFLVEHDFAGGPVRFPMAYNDSTVAIMRHLFGTNVTTGASAPYTHLQSLSSPPPTGLTIEQISGTSGGGGNMAEVFEGCLINSAAIQVEAGGQMMCDMEVLAETSGGLVAPGTPSLNVTREYIEHRHSGGLTIGGTAFPFKSIRFNLNRNLERNHEMGSLFTSVPVEGGLDLEIEIQALWQGSTGYNNYLADTQGDLALTFTGTSNNRLVIAAHNCLVVGRSAPVSSKGGITETLRLRPLADASDQGLTFEFRNSNALHTTN